MLIFGYIHAILAEIHLANEVIPKMLENRAGKMNTTIRLNVDGVILKMLITILPSQNVLGVFSHKILAARPEKHNIDIYRWEGY